jgi:tRNA (guanine26-N2/guanine27-N2)-dimethyltransferase
MGSPATSDETTENDNPREVVAEVTYYGNTYNIVREGMAEILDLQPPKDAKTTKDTPRRPQSVFYNPIQQYNRDLSVLAIKAFGEDLATIRKARHERRLEQLAKGGQRGKKRKRPQVEAVTEADDSAPAAETRVENATVNGISQESSSEVAGARAIQEAPPSIPEAVLSKGVSNEPSESCDSAKQDEHGETASMTPKDTGERKTGPSLSTSFRILDALSATGLRALRYAKEIPMATSITANDLSSSATASIALNVEHNKLAEKIVPTASNAVEHMHFTASHGFGGSKHYHVIDLDPYGTAAPFLDSAVQAIADGGLLCVTCTDAGVFASLGYLEKTYSQYGGLPLKGAHAHEGGLRLILHAIATSAARYGMAIEPLLSLSIDFYARVFVRVHRSPAEVKFLASKTMVVYNCDAGCGAWSIQHLARTKEKTAKNGDILYNFTSALAPSTNPHCEHCGFKTHHAGPMWGGPLHNPHFIQRILDMLPTLDRKVYGTIPRIEGMLSIALNESFDGPPVPLPAFDKLIPPTKPATRSHHPFFFLPSNLSRILHCVSPSDAAVRGALMHLGYRTTRSHTKAGSICTDAPWSVIWEVMREWVRQKSPVKTELFKKSTAGWGIMQKDRSRIKLMEAQQQLREAVQHPDLTDLEALKEMLEAALHRLSEPIQRKEQKDEEAGENVAEEHVECAPEETNDNEGKHTNGDKGQDVNPTVDATKGGDGDKGNKEAENATGKRSPGPHPSMLEIVFDEKLGKEPQGKRMVKYQQNPRPDWGPMNRAKGD